MTPTTEPAANDVVVAEVVSETAPVTSAVEVAEPEAVTVETAPLASTELPASASLTGLRHEWQTWNNCGPATLATYLSYYGSGINQAQIGSVLRRSEDDKNVSPEELHAYAAERGMHAILRVNGSADMLRTLVANGYPVLIETWLEEHPNDGMGHYRLVTGYDDARQAWQIYDSYVATDLVQAGGKDGQGDYAGSWFNYATAEEWWKVFNRTYLLVYPAEDEGIIQSLLGAEYTSEQWSAAEAQAQADLVINNSDAFAWFNLGTSLWNQGRVAEAVDSFDQARAIGLPWRMLWYQFAIFPAYLAVDRADDALALADATLANTSSIEEITIGVARRLRRWVILRRHAWPTSGRWRSIQSLAWRKAHWRRCSRVGVALPRIFADGADLRGLICKKRVAASQGPPLLFCTFVSC